jgi:hypothetical protein
VGNPLDGNVVVPYLRGKYRKPKFTFDDTPLEVLGGFPERLSSVGCRVETGDFAAISPTRLDRFCLNFDDLMVGQRETIPLTVVLYGELALPIPTPN